MYTVTPANRRFALVSTFLQPVSHHDPAQKSQGNIMQFLRRKQIVRRDVASVDTAAIAEIVSRFFVPKGLLPIIATLDAPAFLATALVRAFISAYSSKDGEGLFSGAERYRRLQDRVAFNAVRAGSIFEWWGALVKDMQVGTPLRPDDALIAAMFSIPTPLAQLIFAELTDNTASALMVARLWQDSVRDNNTEFATPHLAQMAIDRRSSTEMEVPAFSANSVRHEIVREPGAIHLLSALGLQFDELPTSAATLLYNGGDLNSAAPGNAFSLSRDIRARYPLLGLIGGSTPGFMLGSSNLEVSCWLVCRENADALQLFGIQPEHSAFDLLDRQEQTRHTGGRTEGSPMPFGFETLIAGSQLVIELRLRPYATDLEIGALAQALTTYFELDGTLGGHSARGYGLALHQFVETPDQAEQYRLDYNSYLATNREALRAGLLEGTLGTGAKVL